jgi:hypothetical protein
MESPVNPGRFKLLYSFPLFVVLPFPDILASIGPCHGGMALVGCCVFVGRSLTAPGRCDLPYPNTRQLTNFRHIITEGIPPYQFTEIKRTTIQNCEIALNFTVFPMLM